MASNDVERRDPPSVFVWRIKHAPKDRVIESPHFTRSKEMTKWRINLFPSCLERPSSCSIQRMPEDDGPDSIEIKFELSIIHTNRYTPRRSSGHFRKNDRSEIFIFPEIDTVLNERRPEGPLNFALSIRCFIWLKRTEIKELKPIPEGHIWKIFENCRFPDYSDLKMAQIRKKYDKSAGTFTCPLKEVLNKLKDREILSDVSLKAGNESFPVHKFILSSRSPVFKAMFTSDWKEKTSKFIDIPDVDADTLKLLLLYIYKDEVQELTWKTAANLFEAADKYELMALKEKCSCFLKSHLSKSNVCKTLVLANMHCDGSLRNSVQKFIMKNPEIVYTNVWKDFKKNYSNLALETIENIVYGTKYSIFFNGTS